MEALVTKIFAKDFKGHPSFGVGGVYGAGLRVSESL